MCGPSFAAFATRRLDALRIPPWGAKDTSRCFLSRRVGTFDPPTSSPDDPCCFEPRPTIRQYCLKIDTSVPLPATFRHAMVTWGVCRMTGSEQPMRGQLELFPKWNCRSDQDRHPERATRSKDPFSKFSLAAERPNRHIPLLESPATHSKQRELTFSNRHTSGCSPFTNHSPLTTCLPASFLEGQCISNRT